MRILFILLSVFMTIHCVGQTNQTTQQKNTTTKKKYVVETINKNGWHFLSASGYNLYAIFNDDFNSPESASSWNLLKGGNSTAIENNKLKFHFETKGRTRTSLIFSPMNLNDNDFEVKTIVDIKSNTLYEGIIFGFKDNDNYSSITFNTKEKMLVYEKVENGITTEDDEAQNIYSIDCADNEVRLIWSSYL